MVIYLFRLWNKWNPFIADNGQSFSYPSTGVVLNIILLDRFRIWKSSKFLLFISPNSPGKLELMNWFACISFSIMRVTNQHPSDWDSQSGMKIHWVQSYQHVCYFFYYRQWTFSTLYGERDTNPAAPTIPKRVLCGSFVDFIWRRNPIWFIYHFLYDTLWEWLRSGRSIWCCQTNRLHSVLIILCHLPLCFVFILYSPVEYSFLFVIRFYFRNSQTGSFDVIHNNTVSAATEPRSRRRTWMWFSQWPGVNLTICRDLCVSPSVRHLLQLILRRRKPVRIRSNYVRGVTPIWSLFDRVIYWQLLLRVVIVVFHISLEGKLLICQIEFGLL